MPDVSTVHHDVTLTNLSVAYRQPGFIAPEVAPAVAVRHQSDRYFIYDAEREVLRTMPDGRAPGAEASEIDFALSHDSYYCDDHALVAAIPDEERDNADSPLQPEIDRTEFLTARILLNAEVSLASRLRDAATIPSNDLSATAPWDDDTDGDPIGDIEDARGAILSAIQHVPNTLVLPYGVYTAVRYHPTVTERVKYTNSGMPGEKVLADLFDVERVIVARAVRNTAPRGQAPAIEPVWGKDALLLHVPPRPGLKTISAALTFTWAQAPGSSRGTSVQTWREERRKATMIRVQKYYDQKIVAPGAAFLLRNAIS